MATYEIKYRKKSPYITENVAANSREEAIMRLMEGLDQDSGEELEVFDSPEQLPPGGVAGATGVTGTTGATGPAAHGTKPTRAQLNEMSKDELLAVADKEGAEVAAHWTKADIVDAIVKHK